MPWSPYDLPFILEKTRHEYTSLINIFHTAIDKHGDHASEDALKSVTGLEESATFLDSPDLFWADTDICDLLKNGGEVPPWSPESCLPGASGFVGLEKPFFTAPYEHTDAIEYSPVLISGIGWETVGDIVRVHAWCHRRHVPSAARSQLRGGLEMEEVFAISFPTTDVVSVDTTFTGFTAPGSVEAGDRLRDTVGGFWLLMAQPRMVEDTPAVVKVRKRRGGKSTKSPVRVSVRSLVRRPQGRSGDTGRKATSRWWVRGHWRQQAWGKGRKLRKPVFIQPHTAGAQGAKVDKRPKVQVWRTGEKDES